MIVLHHLTASFEHGTEERFKVVAVRLGAEKTPIVDHGLRDIRPGASS